MTTIHQGPPPVSPTPSVALVFSGGARYAAAQAGMLRALWDSGVRPDLVIGTSAGALNAAAFAADPTDEGIERLVAAWEVTRRSDVFPFRPVQLLRGLVGHSDHLVPQSHLRSWLAHQLDLELLEDTVLPLHVVATDRSTGGAVVLSQGPALPALLASCAIPGVFSPVEIGGRELVDGGLAADTPVGHAVALGATTVFVLPSHAPGPGPIRGNAVAQLTYAYSQVFGQWTAEQSAAIDGVDVELLPLPPRDGRGLLDFGASADLIAAAEQQTRQWLAERADRAERAAELAELVEEAERVAAQATSPAPDPEGPAPDPVTRPRLDRELRLLPTPHGRSPLAPRPFAFPANLTAARAGAGRPSTPDVHAT
jgi:NTE family protein